ncbi:MarR family transcriptional regulator [Arthrobacter sp. NA-172]|uniref:MarR family transcriptional regulator n=1 Tax=Arthrobacter sp. NA-172 TaxID=3367524 RepID=UPI0037540869
MQWQTLNVLADAPLSPGDLDGVLNPFWGSDTRRRESELAALVGRGLIIMVHDRISLSELGHAKNTEAQRLVEDSRLDISMGIGMDEYAMALSVLERMTLNAERLAR